MFGNFDCLLKIPHWASVVWFFFLLCFFLSLSCSSLHPQFFLPPDCGHLALLTFWLSACPWQPSLSRKLVSSTTLSRQWGQGEAVSQLLNAVCVWMCSCPSRRGSESSWRQWVESLHSVTAASWVLLGWPPSHFSNLLRLFWIPRKVL